MAGPPPYVYVPRVSKELTAPEFSTVLTFYTHPNAPKRRPPQPSQPYVYTPRFSTELSAPELSILLTFYTHPNVPRRKSISQPCQPYVYVRQYSSEYTDSELSALYAFTPSPFAVGPSVSQDSPQYSASEQSALEAFSSNRLFSWACSPQPPVSLPFAPVERTPLQKPVLQPAAPMLPRPRALSMAPGQTKPPVTMPMETVEQEMVPHLDRLAQVAQQLSTAAATIGSGEPTRSANPSQLGSVNTIPQPLSQQPAGYTTANAPQEDIPRRSTHDELPYSSPTSGLSLAPLIPAPALYPSALRNDDDEEDDDNNILKAHRRARVKRDVLVGGPMRWMPEKVAYGLKEALRDLKAANRRAKKRLMSRKKPISTAALVDFAKDFEGFMPGDRATRSKAKRAWINSQMQGMLDEACGRSPPKKSTPTTAASSTAPGGDKQSGPSASGGNDGAADTAKTGANDDDDLLPADWAVGEDEVCDGIPDDLRVTAKDLPSSWFGDENGQVGEPEPDVQTSSRPSKITSTADARASGLDSMMSRMSIGKCLSQTAPSIAA